MTKINKKKVIMMITIIVILVIAASIILMKKTNNSKNNNERDENILYTHELKYNIYIDENGDYVKEYENGDKTIETRK